MGWFILIVFVFIITTLLFAPFRLSINTFDDKYFLCWGDIIYGKVIPLSDDIEIQLNVFGFKKSWTILNLITEQSKEKNKTQKPKKEKKVQKKKSKFSWDLISPILRSFKIKKLFLNVDFNSVYWNSWLYPFGQILQKENIQCTTNFEGKNELILEIVNRPFWLVRNIVISKLNLK